MHSHILYWSYIVCSIIKHPKLSYYRVRSFMSSSLLLFTNSRTSALVAPETDVFGYVDRLVLDLGNETFLFRLGLCEFLVLSACTNTLVLLLFDH